jgi:uncharacterized protein
MFFCDTSTLAKYYVLEKESPEVRNRLDNEDQVSLSELARVELMGVFHRRLREHRCTQDDFLILVRQFTQDDIGGHWTWLPLDSLILEQSAKVFTILPKNIFLRTADCLHLLTALRHGFQEIHTHDIHQTQAASVVGLKAVLIQ